MSYNFFEPFRIIATIILLPATLASCPNLFSQVLATTNEAKTYVLPINNDEFFESNDTDDNLLDYGTYDFVIVGGGTAGGVLAYRLTEENYTVLVIEAGKIDPPVAAIAGVATSFINSDYNWGYYTVPQKYGCLAVKNRSCPIPTGKVLGGSSVMGVALYTRGAAADFDRWAALGNSGWSYKDCLPYFKKSENAQFKVDIDDDYHGHGGPQSIGVVNDTLELTATLLDAFKELGKKEGDYNGRDHYTVSRAQSYIDFNIKSSTAYSFLRPAQNRSNLYITLKSLATKIQILDRQARGVEFVKGGQKYFTRAKKEVIVSGGSINTPQLLMLSGIGPINELNKHGIELLANLPVGEYLSDHMVVLPINFRTNKDYFGAPLNKSYQLWKEGKRPLNGAEIQALTYWNLTKITEDARQDIGINVFAAIGSAGLKIYRFIDEYVKAYETINSNTDVNSEVVLFYPKSYGKVTLQSNNPRDFPLVDPNYLSEPSDIEDLYKGIQIALKLNNTESFRKSQIKHIPPKFPGCDEKYKINSKKWWYCGIQHIAVGMFHPISSTRMGTNPNNSVVNSELKVHGIKGLRVVDAGVIPSQFSGHPNAVVVMIAEKIADAIKAEHKNV